MLRKFELGLATWVWTGLLASYPVGAAAEAGDALQSALSGVGVEIAQSHEASAASGALTLEHALALAALHHPTLSAFAFELRAAEARTLQAGLPPNPEIEFEVETFGGAGDLAGFDGAESTVLLSQDIELGGKRDKRRRVGEMQRALAGLDYEAARLDVFTEVFTDFIDVLAAQQQLGLAEDSARLAEEVVTAVAARVAAGKVSPVEETRARIEFAASRIAREEAGRALVAARKRLAAAWGNPTPHFERAEGRLTLDETIPSEQSLRGRLRDNPDLARWGVELEEREAALALERANALPDLTLSGGVQFLHETDDEAFIAGVSIPLPLFDRNQGAVLEARYNIRKAQQERRAAEAEALRALADAYQDLANAHHTATTLEREVIPGATQVFEAVREGYRQGKFSYLAVLDAQRTYIEVQGQYIDALAAYPKATAAVYRLVGMDPAARETDGNTHPVEDHHE